MANYYSQTMLRKAPDGFRLSDAERALLELMGFTVHAGSKDKADYVHCDIGANNLTIETIRDDLEEYSPAVDLAEKILASISLGACEADMEDRSFDYADLYHHALQDRGCAGCIQFCTAQTCDKARIDGFGGSALHITAKAIEHIDTDSWLRKKAEGAV